MAEPDDFSRYARLGLVVAALVAAGSVGYRLYADRAASAPVADAAGKGNASDALAGLEARTRDHPDDAAAWQSLGWAYFSAERYGEAASAYRHATQIQPGTAILWSSLGESLVMASAREPMPAEALAAFRKAHELDAKDPRARYFLAVARDLTGDHKGAIADWLALLADTPPGAPWEADLRRTIEQVGKVNHIETAPLLAAVKQPAAPEAPVAAQAIPGPSREQMQAAAAAMTPAEQRQMAEGMVGQLEEKLKAEPGRVEGWLMLIRSRMSLGEPDKARAALDAAVKANPGAANELRAQAKALGVP